MKRSTSSLIQVTLLLLASNVLLADVVVVPNFELQTNRGSTWTLSQFDDQPKLLMFWATWCPYCQRLFPQIQALHDNHEQDGLKVVAISVRDDGDTRAYSERHGLTMDILVKGDELADLLGVPGTPAVILLNGRNQMVYASMNSDPTDNELVTAVQGLLANSDSDKTRESSD